MYKIIALSFFLSIFTAQSQNQEDMLIGKIEVSELREAPYSQWFSAGKEQYDVKDGTSDDLDDLLEGVEIKIFMGTWCPDSQREVPRFYKIMESLDFPADNIEMIAMDRSKSTTANLEKGLDIRRVPTFIFYNDGEELGRIVEYPIESLEEDMIEILSGEDYEHAYAN